MKFGKNLFSMFSLFLLIAAGSTFAAAQTTGETKQEGVEKQQAKEGRKHHRGGRGNGFAGREGKQGRHGRRGGMIRGLSRLDLSEPQRSQIKTIIETHKNGQMPFFEEMRALKTKMQAGSATEGEMMRMQELHQQQKASSEQLKTSILGVLTPDQLQRLETFEAERKQKMEERRQRFMQRKQQPTEPVKTDN